MFELKEKRKLRKILYSKPAILILLLLLAFMVKPVWNAYSKYSESRKNAEAAGVRLENMQKRQAELSQKIDSLGTERGLEEEIVDRFNVAREGENVVVIVERRESEEVVEDDRKSGIFSSIWQKIRGIF
jgi:uncharacterized protein YlxW (UPF0749 family)